MNHYLLVFDRRKGVIVRRHAYSDAGAALDARFEAEAEFQTNADIEVVVLGAGSWEDLEHTHTRYFHSVRDMARVERLAGGPGLALT